MTAIEFLYIAQAIAAVAAILALAGAIACWSHETESAPFVTAFFLAVGILAVQYFALRELTQLPVNPPASRVPR